MKSTGNSWEARISKDGQVYYLGSFPTAERAALEYARAMYVLGMGTAPPQNPQTLASEASGNSESDDNDAENANSDNESVYRGFNLKGIPKNLPLIASERNVHSAYKGVTRKGDRWESRTSHRSKTYYLGAFETEKEAAQISTRATYYLQQHGGLAPPPMGRSAQKAKRQSQRPKRAAPKREERSVDETEASEESEDTSENIDNAREDMIGGFDLSNVPKNLPLLRAEKGRTTSEYRGVSLCGRSGKWEARISFYDPRKKAKTQRYLGAYNSKEDAARTFTRVSYYLETFLLPHGQPQPASKSSRPHKKPHAAKKLFSSTRQPKRQWQGHDQEAPPHKKARQSEDDVYGGYDLSAAPKKLPLIRSAPGRKNKYRGVTKNRTTGRFEARAQGKYLGSFSDQKEAALVHARFTYLAERGEMRVVGGEPEDGSDRNQVVLPTQSVSKEENNGTVEISEVNDENEDADDSNDGKSVYGGLDLSGVPKNLLPIPCQPGKKGPYRGVTYRRGVWEARIKGRERGKVIYLGSFKTALKAGRIVARAHHFLTQRKQENSNVPKNIALEDELVAMPFSPSDYVKQKSNVPDIHGGFDLSGVPKILPLIPSAPGSSLAFKGVYKSGPKKWQVRVYRGRQCKFQLTFCDVMVPFCEKLTKSMCMHPLFADVGSYNSPEEAALIFARIQYYLQHVKPKKQNHAPNRENNTSLAEAKQKNHKDLAEVPIQQEVSACDDEMDLYADPNEPGAVAKSEPDGSEQLVSSSDLWLYTGRHESIPVEGMSSVVSPSSGAADEDLVDDASILSSVTIVI